MKYSQSPALDRAQVPITPPTLQARTHRRKSRLLAAVTSCAALSLSLATVAGESASAATIKDGGYVKMVGGETLADNFNPLNPAGTSGTAPGTGSAIYENLAYDNFYTGKLTNILATGYKWSDSNKVLTFTTRSGVDWSDGSPFSAEDVAFTFNYIKKYPALDVNGVWQTPLQSVTATGPHTVVFRFRSAYTPVFPLIVGQKIVPKHIWSKITDPVKFTNLHPVGTGPFLLKSYSPNEVVLVKNPHYWLPGEPHIEGIDFIAVKDDNTEELLLLDGQMDFAYDALTAPQKTFVAKDPSVNHYWWPETDLNFLYFNTAQAPFNNLYLRKAVAMALNDKLLAERAYYGAIPPANGPEETGVTSGQVSQWVPSGLKSLEWKYNPTGALKLLKANGYKLVNGNLETPSGTAVPPVKILVGAGWSDYIAMGQVMTQELKPLGITASVDQEPPSTYSAFAADGNYQLMISWGNGNNASPYYEYYYLFSPNETAPIGKTAATDWERFTSPAVTAALTHYATTTNLADEEAYMTSIEKTVLQDVPVAALTGRANFDNYTTRKFVGWPSAADPYEAGESPDTFDGGPELMFLRLHLK